MKKLKKYGYYFIILMTLLLQETCISQEKISLSIYQDARLMVLGDKQRNKAGTMNLLLNVKLQTKQKRYGYMVIVPEYEQADLHETYKRLSLGIGYTFNRFYLPNSTLLRRMELTTTFSYGIINRFSNTEGSWSFSGEISYKINDWLKFAVVHQLTERTDLLFRYQNHKIRYSFFFGLEFNPFNFGRKRKQVRWYAAL